MPETAVQMNTRIDRRLKESGDDVLRRIGRTPSQAVRAMWEFIASHTASPGEVEAFISEAEGMAEAKDDPVVLERLAALRRGWQLCESLQIPQELAAMDYEQLREEAYLERFGEGIV